MGPGGPIREGGADRPIRRPRARIAANSASPAMFTTVRMPFGPCAALDNRTLKCWGFNMFGQLGLGDALDRGLAEGEMGDDLPAIVVWYPPP